MGSKTKEEEGAQSYCGCDQVTETGSPDESRPVLTTSKARRGAPRDAEETSLGAADAAPEATGIEVAGFGTKPIVPVAEGQELRRLQPQLHTGAVHQTRQQTHAVLPAMPTDQGTRGSKASGSGRRQRPS